MYVSVICMKITYQYEYCMLIFLDLRMELLEEPVNQYLIKALYGLLMIMPQSDAFHLLRHRLKCVPHLTMGSETYVLHIYNIL